MAFTLPRIGDIPRFSTPPPIPDLFRPLNFNINNIPLIPDRVKSWGNLLNSIPRYSLSTSNHSQITNFTAQMMSSNVFARPNRFRVEFMLSNLFKNLDATVGEPGYDQNWAQWYGGKDAVESYLRLTFYCFKAEIPGYAFQTDEHRHYGAQFKYPYMPQYNDITMEFYVGDDMFERWFFEGWMHAIMDPQTQDFNYIGEYSTGITIHQHDLADNTTFSTTLLEAYPIAINQMDLNWDSTNEIHKISVTFTYKRFITLDVDLKDLGVNNDAGRETRERFRNTIILRNGQNGV